MLKKQEKDHTKIQKDNNRLATPFYCCCSDVNSFPTRSSKCRHIKKCAFYQAAKRRWEEHKNKFAENEFFDENSPPLINHITNSTSNTNTIPTTVLKVFNNAVQLVQNLPHTSPLRRPILGTLVHTIKPSEARATFEVSSSTLRRATQSDKSILQMKSVPNSNRTSTVNEEQVRTFWLSVCRVSPTQVLLIGKRKRRTKKELAKCTPLTQQEDSYVSKYYQDHPTAWLYTKYQNWCNEQHIKSCSINTFTKLKPKNVRPSHKLEGICPHCLNFKQHGKEWEEAFMITTHVEANKGCECEKCCKYSQQKELINNNSKLFMKYKHHSRLVEEKSVYYDEVKSTLGDDDVLVVMDFASGWEIIDKAVETTNEFHEKTMVKDMIVVVFEKVNGKIQHTYYDFINDTDSSDHHYVRECFEYLFSNRIITKGGKINIFSDGGPAHYKTARTIVMFGELGQKYGAVIDYAFFPSHHGKSICDSHTGIGKMYIKRKVISREVEVEDIHDIGELLSQLKNTVVVHIDSIRRFEQYNVKAFDGVRKYHRYTYNFSMEKLVVNCQVSYKDDIETNEISLLLNDNQTVVGLKECLYCGSNHYHRICTKFDEDCKADNFDAKEHDFLSYDGTYVPEELEFEQDEDDISDSEYSSSEEEDYSDISEDEQLTIPAKKKKQTSIDSFFLKKN